MHAAPMLSSEALMGRMTVINSVSKFRKYSPSLHASEAEMYSASVDDVNTGGCLAVMKLMRTPSSTITQLPEKDFLSTMSWAQSESAMMVTLHLSIPGGDAVQLKHEGGLCSCLEVAKDSN